MPVEDVGQLLQRWRDTGSLLSRGRVIADGMRVLRGLGPEDRRVLARALAEDGAPELASRIEERTGQALDATELQQVADGLLGLDQGQVDHLAAALADPTERRRLARDALAAADADPPPQPWDPGPAAQAAGGLAGVAGLHALARNEVPSDEPGRGDEALGHPALGEATLTEVSLTDVTLAEPQLHDMAMHAELPPPPGATAVAGAPATDTAADGGDPMAVGPEHPTASADEPDGRQAPDAGGDDHLGDHTEPWAVAAPADAGGDDPRGDHTEPWAVAAPAADAAALADRLRRADTAVERFAILSAASVAVVGGGETLHVLEAVPAGWQRRRAVERLRANGRLEHVDPVALLRLFPNPADATFVAGGLLASGLTDLDGIAHVLPERTRKRFAVRLGR